MIHRIITLLPLLLLSSFAAPTPSNLLSRETLTKVLVDLELVEVLLKANDYTALIAKEEARNYNNGLVYELHQTDLATFQKSYTYYLAHRIDEMIAVYGEVIHQLEVFMDKSKTLVVANEAG